MKKLKLVLALLATALFALAGTRVFADDATTYTITITNPNYSSDGTLIGDGNTYNFDARTYEAYQIFKGDYSYDATTKKDTLSNITWGDNINTEGKQALAAKYDVSDYTDAAAVAAALAADSNGSAFAAVVGTLNNDATGYKYLIGTPVKSDPTTQSGKSVAITVSQAGYYFVADKLGSLTDQNKAYSEYILQVVGDTTVNSKLSIPSVEKKVKDKNDSTNTTSDWQDYADYDLGDDVPFKLTASLPTRYSDYTSYYIAFEDTLSSALTYNNDAKVYVVNGDTRQEVTSKFDTTSVSKIYTNDLKQITTDDSGAAVTIDSSSKIVVEYSAKLGSNGLVVGADNGGKGNPNTVHLTYSNNPNYTGDGSSSPKGKTPDDKVTVFTFNLTTNKVDEDLKPLSGATFTLSKAVKTGDDVTFSDVALTKSTGGTSFSATGLDEGIYKLEETVSPTGYNKLKEPIYFKVTSVIANETTDPTLTKAAIVYLNADLTEKGTESSDSKVTISGDEGKLVTQIINGKGSLLPETGSIGTTVLYVLGTVLVLGAGVLLVTKKRMETK